MEDIIMTLEEFVFNIPLYHKVDAHNGYNDIIEDLKQESQAVIIEGYNPIHKKDSTFFLKKGLGNFLSLSYNEFYYEYSLSLYNDCCVKTIIFCCQRYFDNLVIAVYHDPEHSVLEKIGQYPSIADIHIGQVKQYDKVLEKPILKEFTRAIGLAANGVGIGSFVYLRRIFEGLIRDAYNEAQQNGKVNAELFEKQRMDEKIESLKGYLPPFIVENHGIYGILSKGIHELSEDECLAYFDCMRQSIELILDERLEQLAKKKKQEEVKKSINSIASKIKK